MATLYQRNKILAQRKKDNARTRILKKCPQARGWVNRVTIVTPRKPNSAKRPVIKVFLKKKGRLTAHIPGIGHSLKKFSKILVRGRGPRDLPGIRYSGIRGVLDFIGLKKKKRRRSIYGAEQNNLSKIRARRKYRVAIRIAERDRVRKDTNEKILAQELPLNNNINISLKQIIVNNNINTYKQNISYAFFKNSNFIFKIKKLSNYRHLDFVLYKHFFKFKLLCNFFSFLYINFFLISYVFYFKRYNNFKFNFFLNFFFSKKFVKNKNKFLVTFSHNIFFYLNLFLFSNIYKFYYLNTSLYFFKSFLFFRPTYKHLNYILARKNFFFLLKNFFFSKRYVLQFKKISKKVINTHYTFYNTRKLGFFFYANKRCFFKKLVHLHLPKKKLNKINLLYFDKKKVNIFKNSLNFLIKRKNNFKKKLKYL